MKCPSIVCVWELKAPFATSAQIQLLMCLHFSGLSFRRPSCGISLYDFTIRASLQLIFSCGICHSWTHFISAKVGPYLSKMYTFSTKPHTTRKEQRNNTDKSEYTSANLQMRFFSHLPSFCFIITVLTSYFPNKKLDLTFSLIHKLWNKLVPKVLFLFSWFTILSWFPSKQKEKICLISKSNFVFYYCTAVTLGTICFWVFI